MDTDVLRKYKGKGTFGFKLSELCNQDAEFVLYFYSNSKMIVETEFLLTEKMLHLLTMQTNEGLSIESKLNGVVVDENDEVGTILIDKLVVNSRTLSANQGECWNLEISMLCFSEVDIVYSDEKSIETEIHYGLTNLVFTGCEYSIENKTRKLDKFKAFVNTLNIVVQKVENYGEIETRLKAKKGCFVTSEAIISVAIDNIDVSRNTILDIAMLLSLATRNYVRPIYEDYFYKGKIIRTILNPLTTHNYKDSDYLIDVNIPNPCSLKDFLETTFDKYQEYKGILRLNATISLYLISGFAVYTEAKFILMFVAVESLLSNFEHYLETIGEPVVPSLQATTKKKLTKVLKKEGVQLEEETIDTIINSIAYQHTTFDDKLNAIIKKYSINCTSEDRELMSLRNKVVHNGAFPKEFNSRPIIPYEEYTRLVYFVDRILLTILDYKDKPFLNEHEQYKQTNL